MHTIRISIGDNSHDALAQYARQRDTTISAIVKGLLADFIESKHLMKESRPVAKKQEKKPEKKAAVRGKPTGRSKAPQRGRQEEEDDEETDDSDEEDEERDDFDDDDKR